MQHHKATEMLGVNSSVGPAWMGRSQGTARPQGQVGRSEAQLISWLEACEHTWGRKELGAWGTRRLRLRSSCLLTSSWREAWRESEGRGSTHKVESFNSSLREIKNQGPLTCDAAAFKLFKAEPDVTKTFKEPVP